MNILLLPILIPFLLGFLILLLPKNRLVAGTITVIGTTLNLILAVSLFKERINFDIGWIGFGIDFSLRLYHFSAFIMAASAGFGFLISLYCLNFMKGKDYAKLFYAYMLITIALVNGAVLADNLIVLLFFWEGLLATLFGMIYIGGKNAFHTATKAFIIAGVSDLCMMVGIGIAGYIAGTFSMSKMSLEITPLAGVSFILIMIGAISKAGSMPFHSWIPDASIDAPLPFMAFLPASLEKLLGIYFLSRVALDLFKLQAQSHLSYLLMIIGAVTILLAVMMALIQKDYKKLLSYHAISQVGYMILGIGTAVPVGIVGGIFHMINHAMYKSCLFLTGGAVEKQTGTTNLEKLGGLVNKMPITFGCFLVAAASISGVPPFNGFFSKELIYDGALERGTVFYIAALAGSFFTAISFLKLGHAAFFGKLADEYKQVKEASWLMLLPMIVIAGLCILFGVYNPLPINNLIVPILPEGLSAGHHFSGFPSNFMLIAATIIVLAAAFITHMIQAKKKGAGVKAADYIHYAPGLSKIYDLAERRFFDPYNIGLIVLNAFSRLFYGVDRIVNWFSDEFLVRVTGGVSCFVRLAHNGSYATYLGWALIGTIAVLFFMIR